MQQRETSRWPVLFGKTPAAILPARANPPSMFRGTAQHIASRRHRMTLFSNKDMPAARTVTWQYQDQQSGGAPDTFLEAA